MGCCCCYLSAIAVASAYFTTRLSIAIGIVCAGTGIGAFAVAPLVDFLIEEYGWRGALLIMGGICYHICVYSLLLRPLPVRREDITFDENIHLVDDVDEKEDGFDLNINCDVEINVEEISSEQLNLIYTDCKQNGCGRHELINTNEDGEMCQFHTPGDQIPADTIVPVNSEPKPTDLLEKDRPILLSQKVESGFVYEDEKSISKSNDFIPKNKHLDIGEHKTRIFKGSMDANLNRARKNTKNTILFPYSSNRELRKMTSQETIRSRGSFTNSVRKRFLSQDVIFANSFKNINSLALMTSIKHLLQDVKKQNSLQLIPKEDDEKIIFDDEGIDEEDTQNCNQDNPNSSPKEQNLSKHNSNLNLDNNTHNNTEKTNQTRFSCSSTSFSNFRDEIRAHIHRNAVVLKDRTFMLYGISNLVCNLAYATPVIYIVDRAIDEGLDKRVGALLISINGVGSILGRLFFGAITHRMFPDRLMNYIFVLAVGGISTMLSPLCGSSFILHAVYSFIIGAMIGGYSTLCAVVTIDLMGAEKGTEAFGLLLGFMGITCLTGPPIGGLLFDASRTYLVTYIVFGFFLLASALIMLPTAIHRRCKGIEKSG